MSVRNMLSFYPSEYFTYYKELMWKEEREIISVTKFIAKNEEAKLIDPERSIIDISSTRKLNAPQYTIELLLEFFPEETIFVADQEHQDFFTHEFRLCFEKFDLLDIEEEFLSGIENKGGVSNLQKHKKLIDLNPAELNIFLSKFNRKLYGHDKFKSEFEDLVKNFRIFNKLGEHKILSLFLMGDSGVGKTEVARALHSALGGKKKLAKVNFGNYSNENSLSSLIGSPRGYTGSEDGEIFIRVNDSDTGVILIDEFEKSNSTLFNYFLDVLENGVMSSSMADDIDLSGFIIVFTSNVGKEDFPKRISPELRSRFDYKGFFSFLNKNDKERYVKFRVNSLLNKYNENFSQPLPEKIEVHIISKIQVGKFNNLRDLNKQIKSVFVECIIQQLND